MTAKGGLSDFFGKAGNAQTLVNGSTKSPKEPKASPAKVNPTAGSKRKATQTEWMAADERSQLEKALRLSLQESEGAQGVDPINESTEPASDTIKIEESGASTGKNEPVEEQKAAVTPRVPAKVAPLFTSKKQLEAPQEPPSSAVPLLDDQDFAPLDAATTLRRLGGSLDCLHLPLWISSRTARQSLTEWLLTALAWHRVTYTRPGPNGGQRIVTPRFTTTFGKDDTGSPMSAYKIKPKEIPGPLKDLIARIETLQNASTAAAATSKTKGKEPVRYNCCILNYYADGNDSISYHSDDESFLGPLPNIASLSLGATRDFKLRPKKNSARGINDIKDQQRETLTLSLTEGTLLIMRGTTQSQWEHSIPKRTAKGGATATTTAANSSMPGIGRINITFRRLRTVAGTENFQRYNRGPAFGGKADATNKVPATKAQQGPEHEQVITYRFIDGRMTPASGGI